MSLGNPEHDVIVGIKSFGKKSCDGKGPDAYASVGPVWDWIIDTVHEVRHSMILHDTVLSLRCLGSETNSRKDERGEFSTRGQRRPYQSPKVEHSSSYDANKKKSET